MLRRLAAAIADGEAIDWPQVERRLAHRPEARQADGLRLIAALAEARSGPAREAEAPARSSLGLRLLLALAALQLPFAVLGWLAGPREVRNVPTLLMLLAVLAFDGAGVVLALAGKRDRRVTSLAGFFLCLASGAAQSFLHTAADRLAAYPGIRALTALQPQTFLPFFLWRFSRSFPRVLRLDRWAPLVEAAVKVSAAGGMALFTVNALAGLAPAHPASLAWRKPFLLHPTGFYWLFLSALCLPAPFVAWVRCRHADAQERRRLGWFLGGIAVGVVPLFSLVLMEALSPAFSAWMSQPVVRRRASWVVYSALVAVPLATTTYSILAHRLLSVRLVLRNAARLALARWSALVLAALPSLLLLFYLYGQRGHPLEAILATAPARQRLILAAAGWLLYALRGPLLRRLEILLVGRRRDPAPVLAYFGRVAQNARTAAELGELLADALAELVAAGSAALLVRDPAAASYRPAVPGPRPLPASSGLVEILAAAPEPASLSPDDRASLLPWLAEDERLWAADGDVHLAAPLFGSRGEAIALLVLGAARGGMPYGREEQQAVTALAAAASLALERIAPRDPALDAGGPLDEPAGECRGCGRVAPRAEGRCACGRALAPAAIPFELAGKFRLESVLGEGGMGVVYRASDLALGRVVALKTLPRLGPEALVRLRREARSMAGFLHPNLALIFGAETWRGVPVLVVEYLARGTLAARLGAPLPPQEVARLAADLAAGLEAVHGKGMLHRDVKPSNIGFTEEEVPKLLDFGLARICAETLPEPPEPAAEPPGEAGSGPPLTRTGQLLGTPLYMAPEALRGAAPRPAHDLWSLHLVLWEALAGRHPFAGMPLPAAVRRLAAGEIPDIRTVQPVCPEAVAELLRRGLHPDPRARPATAAAVRSAFLRRAEQRE